MSESGKSRFRNGVRWLWIEKLRRELLSRSELRRTAVPREVEEYTFVDLTFGV
jgi:hypothetical protein